MLHMGEIEREHEWLWVDDWMENTTSFLNDKRDYFKLPLDPQSSEHHSMHIQARGRHC